MKSHFESYMPVTPKVLPSPTGVADWSDCAAIQKRMSEMIEEMQRLAHDVGLARHILEYDHDRRKRALARAMAPALAGGDSAAKAESEGRASPGYTAELAQLAKEHQLAEQTIVEWEVAKLSWETCRSLLAMQREIAKI